MVDAVLLCFEDEREAAQRVAASWCGQHPLPVRAVERHRFPDGELKLRLPAPLPARVAVFRGLHQPNEKLVELLLLSQTARSLGAKELVLLAPYLGYMRQDIAFRPGEAVSQRIVGALLAQLFDGLVTVDPHLHRVATLGEAVPLAHPRVVSAAPLLSDWIARHRPGACLLGPDEESAQWVAQAAARHGLAHAVCRKVRHGDREVSIALPEFDCQGRPVVILDDMVSTGRTVAQAARLLLAAGAASVDVAVTHALFTSDALDVMRAAGVGAVWSSDAIAHPSNVVSVAPLLAQTLAQVWSCTQNMAPP